MNEIPVKNSALPEETHFEDSYEVLKNRFIYLKEERTPMTPPTTTTELTGTIPETSAKKQRHKKIFDP